MNYANEGDRLLHEHGYDHLTEPALDRQWRGISTTEHIEEVAEAVVDEERYSGHCDAGLTRRQREVLRCARLCRRRARAEGRSLVVVIAEELGVRRHTAWEIMQRIRQRMDARRRTAEPPPWVMWSWRDEIRTKQRLIYRRPKRGWLSAYLWARRRGRRKG